MFGTHSWNRISNGLRALVLVPARRRRKAELVHVLERFSREHRDAQLSGAASDQGSIGTHCPSSTR